MHPFTRYFNLTSFIRLKKNYQYKYRGTSVIQISELYTRSKRQREEKSKSQRFASILRVISSTKIFFYRKGPNTFI